MSRWGWHPGLSEVLVLLVLLQCCRPAVGLADRATPQGQEAVAGSKQVPTPCAPPTAPHKGPDRGGWAMMDRGDKVVFSTARSEAHFH